MTTLGYTPVEGIVRPLGNRVLLSPKPRPDKIGAVFLPADSQLNTFKQEWLVLAVGPKVTDIAPGDHVLCRLDIQGHSLDDGTGRVLVDAKHCLCSWRESPPTPASAFGGDS